MSSLNVTLPDGSLRSVAEGTPITEIVSGIGEGLARAAIAAEFNGRLLDLSSRLNESGNLRILTSRDQEALEIVRHSTAHLMAMAVVELFPGTQLTIGPTIENGFYYDFDSSHKFTPDDFPAIEKRMAEIANEDLPVERYEMSRIEAIAYFKDSDHAEPYKVELLEEWSDEKVSFYRQGPFADLCRGPHVPSTGKLGHFKLLSVAGAYWRGDVRRPMLQRIYATAFLNKKDLAGHLHMLEESKKRDHRRLGRELDYFHLDEGSPGMVFWHPRGWKLYLNLMQYIREKISRRGYLEVRTPEVVDVKLYTKSGHVTNYSENMFFTESENHRFVIKPMNCPCHVEVFKQGVKSFRDLPMRLAEFGKCHRNELAGTMHGLMRVRGFTQDDAHIFCTEEQIASEVADFCKLLMEVYSDFGFTEVLIRLADRPEKRVGDDAIWDRSEAALRKACEMAGVEYELNEGDGAFYGPKLEFTLKDSLGRPWQCGTIQVDFNLPHLLGADYIGSDSQKHAPVMLHRAIFGSIERFMAILIENYAGDLPLWINPQQVRVLPISEKFMEYAKEVTKVLLDAGIQAEVDERNDKIGYKIREGEKEKVPYLAIVGEKEHLNRSISLRRRKEGDLGNFPLDAALEKFKLDIYERKN